MFWDNLITLCVNRNISPSALTKELSISKGVVTKWRNGSTPHQTTLLKIANYFNVSVEELISEPKDTPPEEIPQGLDEKTAEILSMYSQLSDEQKKQALSYLEYLAQHRASE